MGSRSTFRGLGLALRTLASTGGSEGEAGRLRQGERRRDTGQEQGQDHRSTHSSVLLTSFSGTFSGIPEDAFSSPAAINCLCPHLLGDASGRLGSRQNLFPDPIQRRGLSVRNLHSHRRHRLQGEVAAGSFCSKLRFKKGALSLSLTPEGTRGLLPGRPQRYSLQDHRGARSKESG